MHYILAGAASVGVILDLRPVVGGWDDRRTLVDVVQIGVDTNGVQIARTAAHE